MLFLILSAASVLLALTFGILTGRNWGRAGTAAGICLPAALLLWILFLSLRAGIFLPGGARVTLPMLGFCALCSVTVCLCALSPRRLWFILGTAEGALASLMILPLLFQSPELWLILAGSAGLLSLYFAAAGAVFPSAAEEPNPLPVSRMPRREGVLTILAGEFAGQSVSLKNQEALCLGADPAFAHIVPGIWGCPPRLCTIRWLQTSNTYLVTCLSGGTLWYLPGHFLPAGGSFQVTPGTIFCLKPQGRLFRVG